MLHPSSPSCAFLLAIPYLLDLHSYEALSFSYRIRSVPSDNAKLLPNGEYNFIPILTARRRSCRLTTRRAQAGAPPPRQHLRLLGADDPKRGLTAREQPRVSTPGAQAGEPSRTVARFGGGAPRHPHLAGGGRVAGGWRACGALLTGSSANSGCTRSTSRAARQKPRPCVRRVFQYFTFYGIRGCTTHDVHVLRLLYLYDLYVYKLIGVVQS